MSSLIGGRYQLGQVIGRGGMAEVLHGTDVRLGRDVAVKVLREDLARDPSFLARFRREAQSAASLDAPTIVAVYDTGEDERGVPWIVMEYVDGRTLREILTTEGRLLPTRACEICADICSALEAAHAAGMVHRDIKPANVMLTSRGEVKVMDFGIARAAAGSESTMTHTSAVIGTAAYLSPEQARGEHVDARSDIYSAGCLLYELVTGAPPFTGDSPVAVAYQHVREDPVPPSEFDPSLAPEVAATLDAMILKAMAKNPANRYQSADEMREDLLRAVAGQPVLATPLLRGPDAAVDVYAPRALKPRRSARTVYTVFAVFLVALVTATALLVHALLRNDTGLFKPPSVVNLTQQSATQQLAAAGLRIGKISTQADPKVPVGIVLQQSPEANFLIRHNGTVDLVISRGIDYTTAPVMIGRTREQVTADLTALKLKAKFVPRDGNFAAGTVLNASAKPGAALPVDTTLTVIVASGNVPVPDVRGLAQQVAITKLAEVGFGIGLRPVASTVLPGTVLQESPVNTAVPRGSDIVLDVAVDPNAQPSASPSAAPSPTATP
ncbi:MAG: serine/threonine protein kinase [Frankiales bacterium]|nr:serine/threonine protein kinase [Frankiales bacterium]